MIYKILSFGQRNIMLSFQKKKRNIMLESWYRLSIKLCSKWYLKGYDKNFGDKFVYKIKSRTIFKILW
jgi:hypothetical protein